MEKHTIHINRDQLTALLLDNKPFYFNVVLQVVGSHIIRNAQHLFRESEGLGSTAIQTLTFFADLETPTETIRCKVVLKNSGSQYYLGDVITRVEEEVQEINKIM